MTNNENLEPNKANKLSEDQVRESVLATNALIKSFQIGPQTETLEEKYLVEALADERTICIGVDGINIPVLLPIDKLSDYKQSYITNLGFNLDSTYFMPAYAGLLERSQDIKGLIKQKFSSIDSSAEVHIFTYANEDDNNEVDYLRELLGGSKEIPIIDDKNGTQASITHFEGLVNPISQAEGSDYTTLRGVFLDLVAKGEMQKTVENGVTIIDPQEITNNPELRDQLWDLCISQFEELGEGLPFEQGFDKDEFLNDVLSNPMTTTIANYKNGRPNCIATFMHDTKGAYWLNEDYYKKNYKDDFLSYFVLIAKEKDSGGRPSMDIIKMLVKLTQEAKKPMWVTFECTNVSAHYVPRIVSMAVNSSDSLKIKIDETAHYPIRAFEFAID